MRILLALLMSFVLLQTQSFALVGGPVFGGSLASVSGTYAGVFVPSISDLTSLDISTDLNTIGLFTLAVPRSDVARGSVAIFSSGLFFSGVITGVADPARKLLVAVLHAEHSVTAGTTTNFLGIVVTGRTSSPDASADASIKAAIVDTGFAGVRLTGNVRVATRKLTTTSPAEDGTRDLVMDGFKQTTEVITPADISLSGVSGGTTTTQ